MKKTTVLFLLLMLFGVIAAETFTIGDGTSTQNYIPAYGLYDYSWTKTIYTAAELSAAGFTPGEMTGLGYSVGNTPSNYTYMDQRVYIRHTTAALYAAEDNTLPANTEFQNVAMTDVTFNGGGWHYLMFSTPFVWNGTDNIEIIWENWDGDYASSYPNFHYTATTDYQAVYKYADNTFPATLTGTLYYNRPNIQIVTPSTTPPSPAILIAPADGGYSFTDLTLAWSAGDGMPTAYNLYFGTTESPAFLANQTATNYALTDLAPGTTYYWQVVPENENGPAAGCPVWSFSTPGADQLAESFEVSVPPAGWASIGSTSWSRSTSYHIHGAASAYRSGSSSNEYILSTPLLTIEAGSSLDFWAAGSNATSGINIVYSSDRENWTQIGEAITHPGSYSFVNYSYDLSSLAGNNYYLGFRTATVTGSTYLDAVIGPNITPVAPGTPTLSSPADLAIDVNEWTTFTWTAPTTGGIPSGYNIYLDTVDGSTLFASNVMSPYSVDTPLDYLTTYYWTVEAVNNAGSGDPATVRSFTTRSNPTISTFPWLVDFGTVSGDWPVANWSQMSGLYPNPTGTSTQWFRDEWLNGATGNNAAKINIYGSSRYGWLVTPPIDIPEDGYELRFDLGLTDYGNSSPIEDPAGQLDDKFMVLMATNPNMTDAVVLAEWNNAGSDRVFNAIPNTGTEVIFPLEGITGTRFFAFYGESTVSNGDNDLFVDNVLVREVPGAPMLSVSPADMDFGLITQGVASAPIALVLGNNGSGILNIDATEISISGTNAEMFSVDTTALPAALAAGQTVSLPVVATAGVEGPLSATLTIANVQTETTVEVPLVAEGMPLGVVIIGNGTANNSIPVNPYYGYTYSQSIFLQSELNMADQRIEKIWYYWNGGGEAVNTNDWTVYMGHTALTEFASTDNWVPLNDLTQVFTGIMVIPAVEGWIEITLDSPFVYNNTDNLVIAVDENAPGYDSSSYYFYSTAVTGNRSLRYYNDGTNPDPAAPPVGTLLAYIPNAMFQFADLPTDPILTVTPLSWDFGSQIINTPHSKSFTISNSGAGVLNVGSVVVSGDAYALEEPFTALSLAAAESTTFTVVYLPTVVGDHTGSVVVTAGDQEITIDLTGSCYDPIISTFPWLEDFGTTAADPFVPVEWSQKSGLYPDASGTYSQWNRGDWLYDAVENNAAKINIYGSSRYGWLITPPVNVPEGNYVLGVSLGLTDWNNSNPSESIGEQADDRFLVIMSDSADMTNPVILREWNNTGSADVMDAIPATGADFDIPLTGISGIKYFAFYAESTESNGDNDLYVDNVTVFEGDPIENPIFAITPTEHNFGELNVGDTASQEFSISNAGEGTLIINAISLSGSDMMSLGTLPTLPVEITGTETLNITVNYAPTAAGEHAATLTVSDNMARVAHNISLSGSAVELPNDHYPPSNLHMTNVVNLDVHLAWDAPTPPPSGEWITWCDPTIIGNAIGTGGAAEFDVAHRYDANDLAELHGSTLTNVQFVPNEVNSTYTVKIWTGTSNTQPSSMIHSQVVNAPVIGEWNNVLLTTPISIPTTGQLWIGYGVNTTTGYPAGCDDGPAVEGKGNMMNFGGWTTLSQVNESLVYNWSIQGYVDYNRAIGKSPKGIVEAPLPRPAGDLAVSGESRTVTRELNGYKLYRDGTLVSTINDPAALSHVDTVPVYGTYFYTLAAAYPGGDSELSNMIEVTVEELDGPQDLAYTVEGNDVNLSWTSPVPPITGDWISWSNNDAALGNSIGTNAAANFDVAHRFEASDLTEYVGGTLVQMKFVPMFEDAVYTAKIWTGGTSTMPGSLVYSQVVSGVTVQDWNTVILSNPVNIEAGQQLWIGYGINTQGGFPAGCDEGPVVEGKGNVMNFSGWTTLTQITDPPLPYNWLIQGMVAQNQNLKAITLSPINEAPLPKSTGILGAKRVEVTRNNRAVLLGYEVYRDGEHIGSINNPETTVYTDNDLPNGDYVYGVSAVYNTGETSPVTIDVNVNLVLGEEVFMDSFEEYEDFATTFGWWNTLDQDASETYGFESISFPGSGSAMAYTIFNPSATVPPIEDMAAYEGDKFAASFAAVNPPNKDWLITNRVSLGTNSSIKLYAKSYTTQYGPEMFRVGVSTFGTIIPQLFQFVSGPTPIEVPGNWTEYIYDLSEYDTQSVFIGIQCVSDDAFIFMLDNVGVYSDGGSPNDENTIPVVKTELKGNYPNPFNPETTIRFSVKEAGPVSVEIYNLKGQLVKRLVNEEKTAGEHSVVWNGTDNNNRPVSSGVYFYRMNAGKYSSSKKMIMMK